MKTSYKEKKPDYILLGIVVMLVVLGLIILASASVVLSQENFGESYYYLRHQLIFGLIIGLVAAFFVYKIHYKTWKKLALPLLLFSILLLLLVFLPNLGYGYGGAVRWIKVGDISVQPSEIAKLGFILYLAGWLEKRRGELHSFSEGLLPFLFVTGVIGGLLVLQPDISTLGIISLTAALIYFIAGGKLSHMGLIFAGGLTVLFTLIKTAPYRLNRLTVFLNPDIDPQGIGYQINQALLAIGSGGILGLGLNHSRQKYNFLPEPVGDSIFAIWAEEMGFVGAIFVILLFTVLVWRGLKIAKNAPDMFGRLASVGIVGWLGTQAFINISAITGLAPLTGIPLPFVSYGGSALIMSLVGVAILLNISKYTN